MRLIITRHGETEENKAGIIQGHLPGKLSAEGRKQAKKLWLRLKNENIDYIYSSDLTRSADTAKQIAKFHPKTPIVFTEELRERYLWEIQGRKRSEVGSRDPQDAESFEALYRRAEKFLHMIYHRHDKGTIVLVWHNGINKAMIAVITGKYHEHIRDIEKQHNTSVNIFDIDLSKNYKIHTYNCIKHLE